MPAASIPARRPWPTPAPPVRRQPVLRPSGVGTPDLAGAACVGKPTAMFFPDGTDRDYAGTVARALAVCASCPDLTRTICLERAKARDERFGIWGGENFERPPGSRGRPPHDGRAPRGVQAMKTAARLGRLRDKHRTIRATAEAAGVSSETARFYLALLDLNPVSQQRVRSGAVSPSAAVDAVRSSRRRQAS